MKVSIDRAKFYAAQRAKRRPSSTPKEIPNDALLGSLKDVKWDGSIDEVMLRILRERLFAALEMLGNRNQKLWLQEHELVKAFHVTRTSDAKEEKGWKLLSRDDPTQPVAEKGRGSTANSPSICLLIEHNHVNSPSLQQANFKTPDCSSKENTSQESSNASSPSVDPSTAGDNSWGNYQDLEPPILSIGKSNYIPHFSLNDLFDTDQMSRFFQLTRTVGVLAPRDGNRTAYALIIPANAFGAKSVVEEVWRLWRFLGGRHA
jgi:hypothetical protein